MYNLCLGGFIIYFPTILEVDCSCNLNLELVFRRVSSFDPRCSMGPTHFLANWRIRHFCASSSHEPDYHICYASPDSLSVL